MIKVWKFVSIVVVLAVCLGLTLVPIALPGGVVSASSNMTISVQNATTNVGFSEAFSLTVEVDNPDAMPIAIVAARLNFDNTYFNVTSITAGPTFPNVVLNQYSNAAGTIDYDAGMPMGVNTTSTSILVCTLNCLSKGVAGSSTVDFVYAAGPPPRKTAVEYGPTDYLEMGNMSLMYSGTVIVSGMPVLTVDVVGSGNVTINNTITPSSYPNSTNWTTGYNVTLEAFPDAGWMFSNWSGVDGAPTANPNYVIMDSAKNVTANFTPLGPVISPDPTSLTFRASVGGANPANQTLDICNGGGGILNWSANITDGNVSWLSMSPTMGINLTAADCNSTQVAVNVTGLTAGTYHANITISEAFIAPVSPPEGAGAPMIDGVAPVVVPVTLHLGVPAISVSPRSLTFTTSVGVNPPSKTLDVCNSGAGTLDWEMADNAGWLSESPKSGSLTEDECEDVTVSVDVSGMEVGDYTATITITGSDEETVPVTLHIVSAMPEVPVGPASVSASGLSITPQQVKPGREVTISISVANTGGETGSYNAILYINGVVEDSQSVSVPGGTSKNVIFTVSKTKAGVYDVSIAGQNGQFEVVGGGGWFGGGLGTGGIIAIVVVVIVLIVAVIFILRGTARPE